MTQHLPARARSARAIRGELVQRRDPRGATANIVWSGNDMPQVPEWDAGQAERYGRMANVIAFRCIEIIADTIAGFPFRAGPRLPERPGAQADMAEASPLARLLTPRPPGGPNPEWAGRQLIHWSVCQLMTAGRFGWEIEYAPGTDRVSALWPLVTSELHPIPQKGRSPRYFAGFYYPDPTQPGQKIRLKPEQVFYMYQPSSTDLRQAISPLTAARYPLSIAVMGDRYEYAFLKNGGVPATVVTTAPFANDDQRSDFQRQWNSQYQGPDNAGATAFHEVTDDGDGPVGEAIDVKVLGVSQRDAQFIASHRASLEQIAIGLGVPWSKLDASGRTFDNASEEDRTWILSRIVPLCAVIEDAINMKLAPKLGGEVGWFDLSEVEVLRTAPRFDAAGAATLVQAGIVSVGEARNEFGLDPETLPDLPALPSGGSDGGTPDAGVARDAGGDRPSVQDVPPDVRGAPAGARGREGLEQRELTAEDHEARRALIWRRHDATVRTLEGVWERAWSRLFERQAKATLGKANGRSVATKLRAAARDRELRADVGAFDPEHWRRESAEMAKGLYEQVIGVGFDRVAARFGISFDISQPYVQGFVNARANQLAGQVTDTTYSQIQAALTDGVAAGEGIPQIAERVAHVFDVAKSRATTIARTEVVSASNASASLAAAQLPSDVVGGQEWIATADGRTREDHAAMDGEVIGIGEAFSNGLAYPGDPSGAAEDIVNCRCTVAFLTPDEMGERGRFSLVELRLGEFSLATVRKGDEFNEGEFRRALQEVAA